MGNIRTGNKRHNRAEVTKVRTAKAEVATPAPIAAGKKTAN